MGRGGTFDFKDFEKLQKNLEKLNGVQVSEFIESCAKELAARLLAKVIKRTPVGDYPAGSGKMGGTLGRGWTNGKKQSGTSYAQSLMVKRMGTKYVIEIVNPVEYASYVEFGHRTANHKGWVAGRFMLTISENELQAVAPAIIEKKLMKWLGEIFK